MLRTLRIRNFALIEKLEIDFGPGLNILTGETGAGKSIIIGALGLVLGARASSEVVRTGAARADVEAVFSLDSIPPPLAALIEQHGLEIEDGELILARTVTSEGRSKAYAAGRLLPLAALAELAAELVDLHGQHEHQSLLSTERQLALLDAYGGLSAARDSVAAQVQALRDAQARIEALESGGGREPVRRLESLQFEAEEIDRARLVPGEEQELRDRRALLTNSEKILEAISKARTLLADAEGSLSAIDTVSAALSALDELRPFHVDFDALATRLGAHLADLEALAQDLVPYTTMEDFDPRELDGLNARLSAIRDLKRKYGESVEEVLAYRARIEGEIATLANRDAIIEQLKAECAKLEEQCKRSAEALTKKRRAAAKRLDQLVVRSLQELGMRDARIETTLSPGPLTLRGADRVEILLAANPGDAPKPLRHVASGGEISRVMLALKSVFAEADGVPSLFFDEIDAGIGGQVATHVAGRLRALAASHQVLCITHLAQIAAAGHHHFHVAKGTRNGVTTAQVVQVESRSRIEEVARLLDGSASGLSLDHAQELLRKLAG
jgi:DNA repair protein RecN (Recombination protein N)